MCKRSPSGIYNNCGVDCTWPIVFEVLAGPLCKTSVGFYRSNENKSGEELIWPTRRLMKRSWATLDSAQIWISSPRWDKSTIFQRLLIPSQERSFDKMNYKIYDTNIETSTNHTIFFYYLQICTKNMGPNLKSKAKKLLTALCKS